MRVVEVDERDSSWESMARFRLYLFEGPGNAVTTLDFVDARLNDVFDAAELAGKAGRLWSVAAVVDDSTHGRGLVWLTGMDYNSVPTTSVEWRARATMQDRYVKAKSSTGQAPVLPDGRRVIRLSPDYTRDYPLWESFSESYAISAADLGLSAELAGALRAWQQEWEGRDDASSPSEEWYREGWRLTDLLQREVAGFAEVRPDFGFDRG